MLLDEGGMALAGEGCAPVPWFSIEGQVPSRARHPRPNRIAQPFLGRVMDHAWSVHAWNLISPLWVEARTGSWARDGVWKDGRRNLSPCWAVQCPLMAQCLGCQLVVGPRARGVLYVARGSICLVGCYLPFSSFVSILPSPVSRVLCSVLCSVCHSRRDARRWWHASCTASRSTL